MFTSFNFEINWWLNGLLYVLGYKFVFKISVFRALYKFEELLKFSGEITSSAYETEGIAIVKLH